LTYGTCIDTECASMNISNLFHILLCMALTSVPAMADVITQAVSTIIDHQPIRSGIAGKSTPLLVTIEDESGVDIVRLYFKTMFAQDYFFLPMVSLGKNRYSAALPPAKNDSQGLDYILLVKNHKGETVRSRVQRVLIMNNYDPPSPAIDEIEVQTENVPQPSYISSFSVPLHITPATEQLLAGATFFKYPPFTVPGPANGKDSAGILGEVGGVAASIVLGGFGVSYKSSYGR
jgi:hypothetical protein